MDYPIRYVLRGGFRSHHEEGSIVIAIEDTQEDRRSINVVVPFSLHQFLRSAVGASVHDRFWNNAGRHLFRTGRGSLSSIGDTFLWADSPEGDAYWRDISNQYHAYCRGESLCFLEGSDITPETYEVL